MKDTDLRRKSLLWMFMCILSVCMMACCNEAVTQEESIGTEPAYVLDADSTLAALPYYGYDAYVELWDLEESAEMLLFKAETEAGYLNYQVDLENAGFSLYAENDIVGNRYATWITEELNVTTMYFPALKSVRILAEKAGELPGLAADNVYVDSGVENVMVQVGMDHDGISKIAMCYLFRLCDGSFVIVDSGYKEEACVEAIYETLMSLAPDPDNIVIASWFITHPHGDHVGGFYTFTETYGDKVTVEQVIYNYPTIRSFENDQLSTSHITKMPAYIAQYGARRIEAHSGQKYYIRDAEIEILYACDLFSKEYFYDMNSSSLVFTITLGGGRIMILGDCGQESSPLICKAYDDYLKSDVIQVSHHGLIGASKTLNELVGAEIVMWPASDFSYMEQNDSYANQPLVEASYLYVAADRATLITLPFDEARVEIWDLYDD